MRLLLLLSLHFMFSMTCCVLVAQQVPIKVVEDWKWLEKDLATISGTLSEEVGNRKQTTRFAFQGNLGKAELVEQSPRGERHEVTLFNETYLFDLAKNKAGKFLLGAVADRNADRRVKDANSYIKVSIAIGSIMLLDAFASNDFLFSDWKTDLSGVFTCNVKCISTADDRPFDTLFAEFDATHHYRVRRFVATLSLPVPMTIEKIPEYGDINLPKKVTTTVQVADRPPTTQEAIYSDVSKSPLPKSEFTLRFYGLPEYAAANAPWSLQFKIFLFTAIIALSGIAIWFFKRDRT